MLSSNSPDLGKRLTNKYQPLYGCFFSNFQYISNEVCCNIGFSFSGMIPPVALILQQESNVIQSYKSDAPFHAIKHLAQCNIHSVG